MWRRVVIDQLVFTCLPTENRSAACTFERLFVLIDQDQACARSRLLDHRSGLAMLDQLDQDQLDPRSLLDHARSGLALDHALDQLCRSSRSL